MKARLIKARLWLGAFVFGMTLLAALALATGGDFGGDVWAFLLVGSGGLYFVYTEFSAKTVAPATQPAPTEPTPSIEAWIKGWLVTTCVYAAILLALASQTGLTTYLQLVKQGKTTRGEIAARDKYYEVVLYTYTVGGKEYQADSPPVDKPFAETKVHDIVSVCYNPANPKQSVMGDPKVALRDQIVPLLILPPLAALLQVLLSVRRYRKISRQPHTPLST